MALCADRQEGGFAERTACARLLAFAAFPVHDSLHTTFALNLDSISANILWKSSLWIWWDSTSCSGNPLSTSCVIL
jgi:hypothetical protein